MFGLRFLYMLALVVWLGGMIVLGAVVAPSTFQVLQALQPEVGRELAGEVFGTSLARFAWVTYAAAGLMIVTLAIMALLGPRPRPFLVRGLVIAAMLAIALYSSGIVANEIEVVQQQAGGPPSRLPATDARRLRFDQLHARSEQLMMINVIGALALLFWEAKKE